MANLLYDVSVSIDGYISGPDGDISQFPHAGPMVDKYLDRLSTYSVALMGRATYEFGYAFGLVPGANPYPHLRSIVFSKSIDLPVNSSVEIVRSESCDFVRNLKAEAAGPIYLCGGGELAGSLARAGLVDQLRLKRPAISLGAGTRLFGESGASLRLSLAASEDYGEGSIYQVFDVLSG